jgi:hypothetical protein
LRFVSDGGHAFSKRYDDVFLYFKVANGQLRSKIEPKAVARRSPDGESRHQGSTNSVARSSALLCIRVVR